MRFKRKTDTYSGQNPLAHQSASISKIHQPAGFCLFGIEHGIPNPNLIKPECTENCTEKFLKRHLERLQRKSIKRSKSTGTFGIQNRNDQKKPKLLGFAHPECNLKRKTIFSISIKSHSFSNFDLRYVCLIIPLFTADKKYITLTIGVPLRNYSDNNVVTKNVFEY